MKARKSRHGGEESIIVTTPAGRVEVVTGHNGVPRCFIYVNDEKSVVDLAGATVATVMVGSATHAPGSTKDARAHLSVRRGSSGRLWASINVPRAGGDVAREVIMPFVDWSKL